MTKNFKFVIIGAGNAAGYAAGEFVKRGLKPGELCIIGEEPYAPYERPALSKGYLNPEGAARLPGFHTCVGSGGEKQPPEWYKEKGIELMLGAKVVSIDPDARSVTTEHAGVVSYGDLIIATGLLPLRLDDFKTPGADAQGVFYLRNVADADALYGAIKAAPRGAKAVVVGGGYIGMEGACALNKNGLDVTMVFPEERCMPRLFTEELASFYEKYYADKGIQMVKRVLATKINKHDDGTVKSVELKDGTQLEAQLVLVGVGAKSNLAFLKDTLQLHGGGIQVNSHLRTSREHVYAVGDIAALPLPLCGGALMRLEHVDNARKSAAHAVATVMGQATDAYDYLPYFYSRVFDLAWVFYGQNTGECIHFGDHAAKKFGAYWVNGGKVVGAFLEGGSADENAAIQKLARVRPACADPSKLKEEGLAFAAKL
eukprot:jgi/Mesvir1/4852/Mv11128-RA.1